MADLTPYDVGWFESPGELRAWLDANHATASEKWVGMRPKATGLPTVTWEQVVDEVLCFGWIDGIRKKGEHGSVIRITPRRRGSVWSARNVARVDALRREGRMRPAGEAAFAARREDRTAIYSSDGGWVLDEDAEGAIRDGGGWPFWEAQPKGYRRVMTMWVMSAKRPDTRARRLDALVAASAAGRRLDPFGPASRRSG